MWTIQKHFIFIFWMRNEAPDCCICTTKKKEYIKRYWSDNDKFCVHHKNIIMIIKIFIIKFWVAFIKTYKYSWHFELRSVVCLVCQKKNLIKCFRIYEWSKIESRQIPEYNELNYLSAFSVVIKKSLKFIVKIYYLVSNIWMCTRQ